MSARLCLVTSGCSVLLCSLSPGRLSVAAHGFSRQNARVRPRPAHTPAPARPRPRPCPRPCARPCACVLQGPTCRPSAPWMCVCVLEACFIPSRQSQTLDQVGPRQRGWGWLEASAWPWRGPRPPAGPPPPGPRLGRASHSVLTETRPSLLQKSRTAIRRTHEHETAELRHNRNPLPTRVPEPRAAEKPRRGSKELRQPRP